MPIIWHQIFTKEIMMLLKVIDIASGKKKALNNGLTMLVKAQASGKLAQQANLYLAFVFYKFTIILAMCPHQYER